MANRFFDPGEQRAARVGDLFTRIAPRYDLINDLQSLGLHRVWKRRMIELARAAPGSRALDVCCGTGDLALALARCGANVAGLDFSERMLEFAALKCKPEGLSARGDLGRHTSRVYWIRSDTQRIPFLDETFDIVTVGYGLRNLASWKTGLDEMRRVAKPGGRILVLDFGKPENPLWRSLYFAYLKLVVPCLGRLLCGSAAAYAYILESLKYYPAQEGVAARMQEMNLASVKIVNFLGGMMSINYAEKRIGAKAQADPDA